MIGLGGYYVGTTDLSTIPDLPTSPYSWTVDTSVGSDMIFQITDANGEMGYIQNIKVAGGTNSSCLATVTSSNTAWTSSTSPVAAQAATSSAADDGSDGYAAATSSGGSNGVGAG